MSRWLDILSFTAPAALSVLASHSASMHEAFHQTVLSADQKLALGVRNAGVALCRRRPYGGTMLCTNFWTCTAAPARSSSLPSSGTGHSRYGACDTPALSAIRAYISLRSHLRCALESATKAHASTQLSDDRVLSRHSHL